MSDLTTCIPHITLGMALMEEESQPEVESILAAIAADTSPLDLVITSCGVPGKPDGTTIPTPYLVVENTPKLSTLHRRVLERTKHLFSYDNPVKEMFVRPPEMND